MSEKIAPWLDPTWKAKLADVLGDVLAYEAPAVTEDQADNIMAFVVNLICGFMAAKSK